MNEKYVISLQLAKALKEAGVKQESEWYWMEYEDKEDDTTFWNLKYAPNYKGNDPKDYVSAFSVGELGEMLPARIQMKDGTPMFLNISKSVVENIYFVRYTTLGITNDKLEQYDNSMSESMGKMLLYLLQNYLIGEKGTK